MAIPFRCPGCAEVERVADEVPREEKGIRVVLLPHPDELDEEV